MSYQVLTEWETIERAIAGVSLCRFGDGELRLATGGEAKSQKRDTALMVELRQILREPGPALVCIPRPGGPKADWWKEYERPKYQELYELPVYGSAFISRPDSAPWIDCPEYWLRVAALWRGRTVVLVRGRDNSLVPEQLGEAQRIIDLIGPAQNAFADIGSIEREITQACRGVDAAVVILCLGATATVLAWRLARRGIYALDLGHLGLYLRHRGAYAFKAEDLISEELRIQYARLHCLAGGYGADGGKHAAAVLNYAREIGAGSILDYGAGAGMLRQACRRAGWTGAFEDYDPALPLIRRPPKPADLIACTDVLEHVEPMRLAAVLDHIGRLMVKGAYFQIATRDARKQLPDGRNAHLIVADANWWISEFERAGLPILRQQNLKDRELRLWIKK
jgi:hypothetical protein